MSNDTLIRFKGHFDKSIPDFFEELWAVVKCNEVPNEYICMENEIRHQYSITRGSTWISAWSVDNTETLTFQRTIKIEYEDERCNQYQMVIHHDSRDGKYRLAMPLAPTLEGPFDE